MEQNTQFTRTRFLATFTSMMALAFSAGAQPETNDATPLPATQAVSVATATAMGAATGPAATTTAAAAPTTVAVKVVQAEPTTREVIEAARKGDVYYQAVNAVARSGVKEWLARTQWWRWTGAFAAIGLGLMLGWAVARVLRHIGLRAAERARLLRSVIFSSIAGPISLFIATIGLGVAFFPLLRPPPSIILLALPAFQLLHIFIVGWLLFNLVDLVTLVMTRLSRGHQGNLGVMLVPLTRRTLRGVLVVVLLLFAANNVFNWQIGALLAGVGIAGLAVSLAAQDTLRNLFGSIMIFVDQPFAIGDYVKIENFEGNVEDIGFRSTRLRTPEGFIVSVPNSKMADSPIQNTSRRRSIRRVVDIGLPYTLPPEKVAEALRILREIMADPTVASALNAPKEPPRVIFEEMQGTQMRLRIFYWYRTTDFWAYTAHAEQLNMTILERFAQAGISLAAPPTGVLLTTDPAQPVQVNVEPPGGS